MGDYSMTLTIGAKSIKIPVLPEKMTVKTPGKNETATVLELGEINIIRGRGLREIAWEGIFPLCAAPYVTGPLQYSPINYVREIQAFRVKKKPAKLAIYGTDLNINMQFAIESFEYEERGGEVGDVYYSISLKEWKDYGARAVAISGGAAAKTKAAEPPRSGSPPEQKTHTVVKGESLWAICQKAYNDGGKYPELYAKNKSLIDGRNKGTGNPKYTIYPGQKLVL